MADCPSGLLRPILVAAYGRVGSTALMALLGTDPRVAFDRRHPFENRYLTYVAKLSLLAGGPGGSPYLEALQLHEHADSRFGPVPWPTVLGPNGDPLLQPCPEEWLAGLWGMFSAAVKRRNPQATHYAEKVPVWLPAIVRGVMPCSVLHLVRDPRDVFLSAREFTKSRETVGFGMEPGTSDMDQARHTAHGLLTFFENELADRDRADRRLVRYEDWVERQGAVVEELNGFLELTLSAGEDVVRHFEVHKTSADLAATVGRWRREPLPPAVRGFLERHLAGLVADYGYELPPDVRAPETIVFGAAMACSADGRVTPSGSQAVVEVTGGDFWVELPLAPRPAREIAELWVCLQGTTGDHCSVYWHSLGEPYDEARSVHVPFRPGQHWQILRFQVGRHALWRGTVERVRLDLFNGTVTPGARGEVRWVRVVES